MIVLSFKRLIIVLTAALVLPFGLASAQSMVPDGSEIVGQPVRVDVGGVSNTVYFNPGGSARIVGAAGQEVRGTWLAQNGNLCLSAGSDRECWPYQTAFRAGEPIVLTSDCGSASRFTALAVNRPAAPVQVRRAGERG